MFEALFILTTVDTGTRVARFLVQEFGGRVHPKMAQSDWLPGTLISTSVVCLGWGYLVWSGSIATIWPMLGISNQLLACIALCAGTTMIVNRGRSRYVWVTLVPLVFVGTATETAGYQLIRDVFIPKMIRSGKPALAFQGWLLASLCALAMFALVAILIEAMTRWSRRWRGGEAIAEAA
jgi:carbon starvation protein